MALALEAVDLAALLAEALCWACVTALAVLLGKLVRVMHFHIDLGIVSFEPLGWLADTLVSHLVAGAEEARTLLEGAMHATWEGLAWSWDDLLSSVQYLGGLVREAELYLWHQLESQVLRHVTGPIAKAVAGVEAKLAALARTVAGDVTKVERYAASEAAKALRDAEAFTTKEVRAAEAAATRYANQAVGKLRAIESAAIAQAQAIAVGAEHEIDTIEGLRKATEIAALIAAIPALGSLVHAIATEAGMDDPECRKKHKQVCGVDPKQWEKLLGGLALLGFAFDFKLLFGVAEKLVLEVGELLIKIEDTAWSEIA